MTSPVTTGCEWRAELLAPLKTMVALARLRADDLAVGQQRAVTFERAPKWARHTPSPQWWSNPAAPTLGQTKRGVRESGGMEHKILDHDTEGQERRHLLELEGALQDQYMWTPCEYQAPTRSAFARGCCGNAEERARQQPPE